MTDQIETRFFVDLRGAYLGAFCPASAPPDGAVQVPVAPPDGRATWDGTAWAMPIATVREDARKAMQVWIERFLSPYTADVPAAEIASWPVKATAAKLHLAGQPQQMILDEAAITGEHPDDLAAQIAAKSDAYTSIISSVTGLRRDASKAIASAKTPQEVSAALSSAQTKALALAAQMGLRPETK